MNDHDFDLGQQIAEFRGVAISRLDSIDLHLKTLNGKVASHEKRLNDMAILDANTEGVKKGVELTWGRLIWICTFIGGAVGGTIELVKLLYK